jgi:hypothetical protein
MRQSWIAARNFQTQTVILIVTFCMLFLTLISILLIFIFR